MHFGAEKILAICRRMLPALKKLQKACLLCILHPRGQEVLHSGARVSNPASRRVLEKCGFQWTSVRLCRIRAINSAAPIDRFRLDRGLWASLKSWSDARQVA